MRHEVRNDKLRAIYGQVPDLKCVEGCKGECCGELITHVAIDMRARARVVQPVAETATTQ